MNTPPTLHTLLGTFPTTGQEVKFRFRITPPTGDGITTPMDFGGVQFECVTALDGSAVGQDIWDWAPGAFETLMAGMSRGFSPAQIQAGLNTPWAKAAA